MGFFEVLLLAFVVLLFFGAGKLPAVGEGLGKAIRGFRDAVRTGPPPAPGARPKELPRGPGDPAP